MPAASTPGKQQVTGVHFSWAPSHLSKPYSVVCVSPGVPYAHNSLLKKVQRNIFSCSCWFCVSWLSDFGCCFISALQHPVHPEDLSWHLLSLYFVLDHCTFRDPVIPQSFQLWEPVSPSFWCWVVSPVLIISWSNARTPIALQ